MLGAGDIGYCNDVPNHDKNPVGNGLNQMQVSNLLMAMSGAEVFTVGDNTQYRGTANEFKNCYAPSWGRVKGRTMPAPGNHDYGTQNAAAYFNYFGSNAGPSGRGYYSYTAGAWHVVSLNSEITGEAMTAQKKWLEADLADNPSVCTLAYWHKPLFTSGDPQFVNDGFNAGMKDIWKILYKANVDIVVNGHQHMYERFMPQDPNGNADTKRGIREFVVGTGGTYLFNNTSTRLKTSEVLFNDTWGILKLTLHNSSYDWQFVPAVGTVPTNGKHTDKGTNQGCH